MKHRIAIIGLLASAVAIGSPASADRSKRNKPLESAARAAQTATQIEVLVIEGSNEPGGVDQSLQNLPQLRRMPFSAYSRLALSSRRTVALGTTTSSLPLPGGNTVAVASAGAAANGAMQVNVTLSLNGRQHNLRFAATQGEPFFTAQSTGQNTALILGFIVR